MVNFSSTLGTLKFAEKVNVCKANGTFGGNSGNGQDENSEIIS